MSTSKKGKFIVIDGPDATGKATQTRLLFERLAKEGYAARSWSFPQYLNHSSMAVWLYLQRREGLTFSLADKDAAIADIAEAFDGGDDVFRQRLMQILTQISPSPWGDLDGDPYTPSLFFAIDRAAARYAICETLKKGIHCIADRYTSANLIHQGSKVAHEKELRAYLTRMRELEHEWLRIPKPDLNFLLLLDPDEAAKFQEQKLRQPSVFREADVLEKNPSHQRAANRMCERLLEMFPGDFRAVECAEGGRVLGPQEVHEKIWSIVKPLVAP